MTQPQDGAPEPALDRFEAEIEYERLLHKVVDDERRAQELIDEEVERAVKEFEKLD